jgi:outer membrane receptor protein involved in Fe transport
MTARAAILIGVLLTNPIVAASQHQAARVSGLLVGADRQPAPHTHVAVLDRGGVRLRTVQTDALGRFVFESIAPGTYTVFAEAPGLGSAARVVTVQGALPVNVTLVLTPHIAQSVFVVGTADVAPSVTTRTTLAGDAIRATPGRLRSRGLQHLLAAHAGWASEDNGLLHVRGVDDGVLFVRDGVPVVDRLDTLFGIPPDPASIESVNVLTGYIPPEYGLKSGAVVEVQTAAAPRGAWSARGDAAVGGDGLFSGRGSAGGRVGAASMDVSAIAERSSRFLDPVHPDNLHNSGRTSAADVHLTLGGAGRDQVRLDGNLAGAWHDVPHGEEQERAAQDQRQRLLQGSASGSWQRSWSDALVSHVAVYHRQVSARLSDSPNDTPLLARSDRDLRRFGARAGVTHRAGRHTLKGGAEAVRVAIEEDFAFAVTDPDEAEEAEISEAAAAFGPEDPFLFRDAAARMLWSFWAQDTVRLTERLTLDLGVRFDRSRLLVAASQWSPRAGIAYRVADRGPTLRASINRFFQPPQPEHLLLSSSPAARALSPFVDPSSVGSGGAAIEPERQTAWEVGAEAWLGGVLRLDAAGWRREVTNYADPNVFFGTTIVFPNSVARGVARGFDLRLDLPRYRGVSAFASYTHARVEQFGPVNGGLFLEDSIADIGEGTRFVPDHDQPHVISSGVTYHHAGAGFTVSLAGRYESGTPLEADEDDLEEFRDRPGSALVDFDAGRTRPRRLLDVTLMQPLRRSGPLRLAVRVAVLNVLNHRYAFNFGNPFSGTHFGAPRTVLAEVQVGGQ